MVNVGTTLMLAPLYQTLFFVSARTIKRHHHQRKLRVRVLKAQGLLAKDRGGTSDPLRRS
jgi:hypothetical protein